MSTFCIVKPPWSDTGASEAAGAFFWIKASTGTKLSMEKQMMCQQKNGKAKFKANFKNSKVVISRSQTLQLQTLAALAFGLGATSLAGTEHCLGREVWAPSWRLGERIRNVICLQKKYINISENMKQPASSWKTQLMLLQPRNQHRTWALHAPFQPPAPPVWPSCDGTPASHLFEKAPPYWYFGCFVWFSWKNKHLEV